MAFSSSACGRTVVTEVCVTPAGEIAISNATINTAFFLPESLSERERADCRADEQKRGDERGTPTVATLWRLKGECCQLLV
jgi:hypothetical protein